MSDPRIEIIGDEHITHVNVNGKCIAIWGGSANKDYYALAKEFVRGYEAAIKHAKFDFKFKFNKPAKKANKPCLRLVDKEKC